MRMRLIILILMMTMPFFTNAQVDYSMQLPIYDAWGRPIERPKTPQLETVKPLSLNRVEKAKAKLAREEQKLIKLARKAWDLEDDLKKEEQLLKNLENTPENSNDPDHQKRIKQTKQQITKSQDKLNKAKIDVESSSKKVEGLEKAIEEVKFTRHY